jgi:microcystin-dependent protein
MPARETGEFIGDLDRTIPAGTDPKSDGDDEIRQFKRAAVQSFPSVTGPVTATHTELSYSSGVTSAIQTQIDSKFPTAGGEVTGEILYAADPSQANALARKSYVDSEITSGLAGVSSVIAGCVFAFGGTAPPSGYLECNGAEVSRTTYAALFANIGTNFGVGNGSTTFNLPDLRGEFIRGYDNGRGVDSGRAPGSAQSSQNLAHTHGFDGGVAVAVAGSSLSLSGTPVNAVITATQSSGGSEARPRNIAMMYIIKT